MYIYMCVCVLYINNIINIYLMILIPLKLLFIFQLVPPAASSGSRSSTSKVHGKPEFFGFRTARHPKTNAWNL